MPKKRRTHPREIKPTFHIFCEGQKTEPGYIKGYIDGLSNGRRVKSILIEPTDKNTPIQLVKEAEKLKKAKTTYKEDIFWVVCDREDPHKIPDDIHRQAYALAKKNDIQIALSSACFEIWLLLHFEASTKHYTCFDDLIRNSALKAELTKLGFGQYEKKSSKRLFSQLSPDHINQARENAKKINRQTLSAAPMDCDQPFQLNPYTDMHKLLDAIDKFVGS